MISSKRAYDIVYLALREIGVVSLGDSIAPDVAQEALLVLNTIRAGYGLTQKNNEQYDQVYTATESKLVITLGTDGITPGDIPLRPARIQQVIAMNPTANGLNITLNLAGFAEYRQIPVPNIAAIPDTAYLDTGYPYQKIWLYPGLTSGWSLRVVGLASMAEYELLDDPIVDPPEYFAPMYLDLALRLAPKYGVDLPPSVYAQYQSAIAPIKRLNFVTRMQQVPNGLRAGGGGVNFFSGMPNA